MFKLSTITMVVLGLCGCAVERPRCEEVVVTTQQVVPGELERVAVPVQRGTIRVQGDAEVLTAPDRFVITVGFDVQASTLARARDDSRERAAALMAVARDHGVLERDLQIQMTALTN